MEYNLFKGLVTHVIDPSNFWMRFGTEYDMNMFCEYQQRLDALYNEDRGKYACSIDQLCPGYLVVVAQLSEDDDSMCHWERAQVTRVDMNNDSADVFFVDLGYTSIVGVDTCRDIPVELFKFLSPQSSRVSLAGIKPLAKSWTSRAGSLLQKETFNRDVLTLLVNYDDASSCYAVVIYTKQPNGLWSSLIHDMQHNELALGTDDTIEKFLTDDVVTQCLQRMEALQKYSDNGTESSPHDQNEETLLAGSEVSDEQELWEDGLGAANEMSDRIPTMAIKSSQRKYQQDLLTDSHSGVTGFDYRALNKTRSISISKMQEEKGWETQEQAKSRLKRGMERLDSEHSHQEDQDWDAIQGKDFHIDIVSQIYHGLDRQYSEDGMSEILEVTKRLEGGPKKPKPVEEKRNEIHHKEEKEVAEEEECGDVRRVLGEVESYRMEKQIKEILINQEEKESDFVCASVYSVVEPDVDTPSDRLQVVICAILEFVIENSCHQSDVAFVVLETYSDADAFGHAMIEVIRGLKNRFVKKHHSGRLANAHKECSKMLAMVFRQAEDWNSSVCGLVQECTLATVERWIIFNKQRQLSGQELLESELIYLECAEAFLFQCHDLLVSKYYLRLTRMMEDIRYKLVEDGTDRLVRVFLLDMLLALNSGQVSNPEAITQTEQARDGSGQSGQQLLSGEEQTLTSIKTDSHQVLKPDQGSALHSPHTTSNDSFALHDSCHISADVANLLKRKEVPKSIRNLPPRLIKKYLQEDVPLPSKPTVDQSWLNSHSLSPIPSHSPPPSQFSDTHQTPRMNGGDHIPPNGTTVHNNLSDEFHSHDTPISGAGKHLNGRFTVEGQTGDIKFKESKPDAFGEVLPSPEYFQERSQTYKLPGDEEKLQVEREANKDGFGETSSHSLTSLHETNEHQALEVPDSGVNTKPAIGVSLSNNSESKDPHSCERKADVSRLEAWDESDDFRFETNDKGDDFDTGSDISASNTVIRYTPQQLRDLNPFQDQPKLELWDLWEPKEVLDKMIVMVHPGRSDHQGNMVTAGLNSSNSANWRLNPLADDFHPSVSPKEDGYSKDTCGSSVDPDPVLRVSESDSYLNSEGQNESNLGDGGGSFLFEDSLAKGNKKSNSLKGIAMDLVKPADGEVWHDESPGPNGDFLKAPKNNDFTVMGSRKVKKKKGRGKPLDEFLQEQADLQTVADYEVEGDNVDYFSPEALQMYEELEQQGVGQGMEMEGAHVLMPSKIGSHVASSSKRSSLFASVRNQTSSQAPPKAWCPGKRFCTKCGSPNHVVYDCQEQSSRLLQ